MKKKNGSTSIIENICIVVNANDYFDTIFNKMSNSGFKIFFYSNIILIDENPDGSLKEFILKYL